MHSHAVALILLTHSCYAGFSIQQNDGQIDVLEDGKLLTSYHQSRVPYLYPLPSDSGANLARNWPIEKGVKGEQKDHPHHRSVWLSHGAVDGYDFWAWTGKGHPRIDQRSVEAVEVSETSATFTVKLEWVADGETRLHETRRVSFERIDPKTWSLGIASTFTTPTDRDVLLGDTKEGTFALRVDRSLRLKGPMAEGHIIDSEGRVDGESWGKRSKWVAFHGPDEKGEPAVIAIFDHPDNLRHPCWWHARDYGLLAANPFGIHDFEGKPDKTLGNYLLRKDAPLTLRYHLVIHHGSAESAHLDTLWTRFSK